MKENTMYTANNTTLINFFKQYGDVTTPNISRNEYTQTIAINANDGVMSRVQVWESEKHDRIDIYVGVLSPLYKEFSGFGNLNNKRAKKETKEICVNMTADSLQYLIDTRNAIKNTWKVATKERKAQTTKSRKKVG